MKKIQRGSRPSDLTILIVVSIIFLSGILVSRIEARYAEKRNETMSEEVAPTIVVTPTPIDNTHSTSSNSVSRPMPTRGPVKIPTQKPDPTPTPAYVNTWNCDHVCDREGRFYDIPLLPEYQSFIHECAHSQGVPFDLAIATCWMESRYTPAARHENENDSIDAGLFQINECNWDMFRELYGERWDPFDPYDSIKAGIWYINYSMSFDDNPKTYMMVYNMGPGGAMKEWRWGKKSSSYTKELLRYMNEELALLEISN